MATTPKKQREYPRVNNIKDQDTQQTIKLLWDRAHDTAELNSTLQTALTAAQATVAAHAETLVALQKQLTIVSAGKGTAQASTVGGAGSGGSSGGSGPGTPGGGGNPQPPPPPDIPNQSAVVAQAKADLITGGIDIVTTPCGPFQITNLAAFRLGGNYGILSKDTGNNCNGASVDIIAVKPSDGSNQMPIFDVLIDAGGANDPNWSFNSFVDASRWLPPVTPPI